MAACSDSGGRTVRTEWPMQLSRMVAITPPCSDPPGLKCSRFTTYCQRVLPGSTWTGFSPNKQVCLIGSVGVMFDHFVDGDAGLLQRRAQLVRRRDDAHFEI